MARITQDMREAQLKMIQSSLQRNPDLTKWHFVTNCGCSMRTMNQWELAGVVKFGKNKRPKAAKYTKKPIEHPVKTGFRVKPDERRYSTPKGQSKKAKPAQRQCAMCGEDFSIRETESRPEFEARKFCSTACSNDHRRGKASPIQMREATDRLMGITNRWAVRS